MMIFAVVALCAVGLGSNATAGNGSQPPAQYPIRFDDVPTARIQQPRATVSYPIRLPSPGATR